MSDITYWLLAIVMLGMVILLHELGHFWAARLTGVRVMEFAIGLGPKIFSRKAKSGVLYSLRAFPLGGFCRFVADDEEDVPDREDAYSKIKIWKRAAIALAGPAMNFLTALVLLFLLFFILMGVPQEQKVLSLVPGGPAETAGFAVGDTIVSINGTTINSNNEVSEAITANGTAACSFTLNRNGRLLTLTATPLWSEKDNRLLIGIGFGSMYEKFHFGQSLTQTAGTFANMSLSIFRTLGGLIFRGEGVGQLTGPIGTVTAIKEQTEAGGLNTYLSLAAFISVNLGLFNLLIIPGLDGSKLIFLAIEKIRGKRLDPKKEGAVMLAGFALMMGLMVLVMYQDIARLLK